jgi:hypothetical protein
MALDKFLMRDTTIIGYLKFFFGNDKIITKNCSLLWFIHPSQIQLKHDGSGLNKSCYRINFFSEVSEIYSINKDKFYSLSDMSTLKINYTFLLKYKTKD